MDPPSNEVSSKLLEVLNKLDARLETLDHRLQALERQAPAHHRSETIRQHGFILKYTVDPDGPGKLQEITLESGDLLKVVQQVSSPCLGRHQPSGNAPNRKEFIPPFTDLIPYRDYLSLAADAFESPGKNCLGFCFPPRPFTDRLVADIRQLLACLERSSDSAVKRRDENLARGVVLFEDLPSIYPPGTALHGPGAQIVEVSSCHMVTDGACVVDVWHFRWDGKDFSRASSRFEVDRYTGTRPINSLMYLPVVRPGSISSISKLLLRNNANLKSLMEIRRANLGDYPVCRWIPAQRSESGGRPGQMSSQPVLLDPASFVLNTGEKTSTSRSSFNCYCSTCTAPVSLSGLMENARYLLLAPASVEAFMFISKQWLKVPIAELEGDPESRQGHSGLRFDSLCNNVRTALMGECATLFAQRRQILGVAELHNGRGTVHRMVLHFHGHSGVGKSNAAIALAAANKRPAVVLRPADLSPESADFSQKISMYLHLGFRWGAVVIIKHAESILQPRMPGSDMTQHSRVGALISALQDYHGIVVFLSSPLPVIDSALEPYIRQISFPAPTAETLLQLCHSYLGISGLVFEGSRDELAQWAADAEKLGVSGNELVDICREFIMKSPMESRRTFTVRDLIRGYTTATGRPNEWDLVTDHSLYGDDETTASLPEVTQQLLDQFGILGEVPDDGRLGLLFTRSFHAGKARETSARLITRLGDITRHLSKLGTIYVVDWGWPMGLWAPVKGYTYEVGYPCFPQVVDIPDPHARSRRRWEDREFSFGIRNPVNESLEVQTIGKPWRRLLLIEGLESLDHATTYHPISNRHLFWDVLESHTLPLVPNALPWVQYLEPSESIHHHVGYILGHLGNVARYIRVRTEAPDFTLVFFRMVYAATNSNPLFGGLDIRLTRDSFTLFHICQKEEGQVPHQDPIHWTMLCLTPRNFWVPRDESYTKCHAPTLRAQSARLVVNALRVVADAWAGCVGLVEKHVANNGEVLDKQDNLLDILFDDDAFSTSKRYFWAINFIHEAVELIDHSIKQWGRYREASITPWKASGKTERQAYWYQKSQEVLEEAEKEGDATCEELKALRQRFQESLARITLLRDGLFNASAVMESRASTQLGENVKLLTFVSIFFLPLGFCVAMWSINESYSRANLIAVTAVVAVATYAITLNLNNLSRGLRQLYAPKRAAVITEMGGDPEWNQTGERFRAFERSKAGYKKPSEWMVAGFMARKAGMAVKGAVGGVGGRLAGLRRRVKRKGVNGDGGEEGVVLEEVVAGNKD